MVILSKILRFEKKLLENYVGLLTKNPSPPKVQLFS